MKVFLSWSGELSHRVALIYREWLPSVLSYVQTYVSSEDIDKGAKWLTDIVHELESTYYGVLCVTKDNVNAPWLVFEAGALTKAVARSRVSPFLFNLGPAEFSGPLTQFQATQRTKSDIRKLVLGINRAAKDEEQIREDLAERIFEKWWPDLHDHLDRLAKEFPELKPTKREPTKQERILEELLSLARSQQNIVSSPEDLLPPSYLQGVLSQRDSFVPQLNHDLCEAAEQLEAAYSQLRKTYRKIKGIPPNSRDELISTSDALREPLDRILMHTEQWRQRTK